VQLHNNRVLRRFGLLALVPIAIMGMAVSAHAASIDGSITVNTSTIKVGAYQTSSGHLFYDTRIYGVPIPSKAYAQHTVPYFPFKKPIVTNTDWDYVHTFYVGTDEVNGKTVWKVTTSFWVIDTLSLNQTEKHQGEFAGSGYIRYGTGKGHDYDRNPTAYVKVTN